MVSKLSEQVKVIDAPRTNVSGADARCALMRACMHASVSCL